MPKNSIRQLEERVVAMEITVMQWNDRMDLLALANARGEVSLHRLTWQKVWNLVPEKEEDTVIDMAWRPDGKILAIGYNTSKVILVEVENKNALRTIHIEENITCVSWQQDESNLITSNSNSEQESTNLEELDDSSKYLPDLPSSTNEFSSGSKNQVENLVDMNFVKNQNNLNILLIGTENGILHISIFGLFTCAVLNISSHLNKSCTILNAHFNGDLSCLYVTISDERNQLQIIVINTTVISTHRKELFAIALKRGHLINLMSYLNHTMLSITEAWESILLEMDSKLSKYATNVPEGTVSADFLDLLMFGILSDKMEEFLMQDLTDKGLKKLGQSIELSYSNIQKLLLKHLSKVGDNITYHLAELRGMAKFAHRYKNLGLQTKTISYAIAANGAFLVKGVEVQQVINDSMTNYKAFFRWLYVVILRLMDEQIPSEIPNMTQQDLAYITEFLQNFDNIGNNSSGQRGRFKLERLGQYLLDAPLTIISKNDNNIWTNMLEENECVSGHESIIKHYESMSLVQQHKHLIKCIEDVFVEPNELITENMKFELSFICVNISDVKHLRMSQLNYNDSVTMITFFDTQLSADGAFVLEFDKSNELKIQCAYIYSSHVPGTDNENRCKILDVKFYSTSYLTLLFEEISETRTSYICQVPISYIKSNLIEKCLNQDELLLLERDVNKIDISGVSDCIVRKIEGMNAYKFSVSSCRHVSVVLSTNERKVQLFEMEADEDEDELEDSYATANTTRDSIIMLHESMVDE